MLLGLLLLSHLVIFLPLRERDGILTSPTLVEGPCHRLLLYHLLQKAAVPNVITAGTTFPVLRVVDAHLFKLPVAFLFLELIVSGVFSLRAL